MASPLVDTVRLVGTTPESQDTAYEPSLAKKASGARFERTESIAARASRKPRVRTDRTTQARARSAEGAAARRARGLSRLLPDVTRTTQFITGKGHPVLVAREKAMRLATIYRMVPILAGVWGLTAILSILGLLLLLATDTPAVGATASVAVSILSLGQFDVPGLGMLCIGISMMITMLMYVAAIVYMFVFNNVSITHLTGIYYQAAIILPVLSMVPGVNIAPWPIAWAFCISIAPQE